MVSEYIDVEGMDTDELLTLASDVKREVAKRRESLRAQLAALDAEVNADAPAPAKASDSLNDDDERAVLAFADEHGDSKAALHFGLTNAWAVKRIRKARGE